MAAWQDHIRNQCHVNLDMLKSADPQLWKRRLEQYMDKVST